MLKMTTGAFVAKNKQTMKIYNNIKVNTEWLHDRLILPVKDHGIGIPVEYHKHLFEQFNKASNPTNIQETGFGLSTANKYVALMNGTIHYTSTIK